MNKIMEYLKEYYAIQFLKNWKDILIMTNIVFLALILIFLSLRIDILLLLLFDLFINLMMVLYQFDKIIRQKQGGRNTWKGKK